MVASTHVAGDTVPETFKVTGAAQATKLPHGVVGGDAVVTPSVHVDGHQVHAEIFTCSLLEKREDKERRKRRRQKQDEKETKKTVYDIRYKEKKENKNSEE